MHLSIHLVFEYDLKFMKPKFTYVSQPAMIVAFWLCYEDLIWITSINLYPKMCRCIWIHCHDSNGSLSLSQSIILLSVPRKWKWMKIRQCSLQNAHTMHAMMLLSEGASNLVHHVNMHSHFVNVLNGYWSRSWTGPNGSTIWVPQSQSRYKIQCLMQINSKTISI